MVHFPRDGIQILVSQVQTLRDNAEVAVPAMMRAERHVNVHAANRIRIVSGHARDCTPIATLRRRPVLSEQLGED